MTSALFFGSGRTRSARLFSAAHDFWKQVEAVVKDFPRYGWGEIGSILLGSLIGSLVFFIYSAFVEAPGKRLFRRHLWLASLCFLTAPFATPGVYGFLLSRLPSMAHWWGAGLPSVAFLTALWGPALLEAVFRTGKTLRSVAVDFVRSWAKAAIKTDGGQEQ